MKKLIVLAALAAAVVAEARTFEVEAWRGETVAARVPDFARLGLAPKGLKVRFGVLKSVKYAPVPDSLQRLEVFDRVDWDSDDEGPRVVEVSVPADAKPGVYTCGHMNVRVVDRVLPPAKEWKYYLDLWQHPWATARMAETEPFTKKHYDAMRPVYELLASAGQKTITGSLLDDPWDHQCFDAYHSLMADDFKLFDEYVAFCLSCGLGPDISCYSLCPWTLGKEIDEAALERRWGAFLERFAAHLKEKGWYSNTLMAMDERAPEDGAKVDRVVQKHAPGLRVSMAGNRKPSDFKGIPIVSYSQIFYHVTDDFLAEIPARRAKGMTTTFYVCCWPPRPNTFMSSGPGEAFWLGAAPAMLGLDGFLRWAWNSWPQDPAKDASYGYWMAGDTFLCYPDGEPSWRFLELRNGINAAETVRILRASGELDEGRLAEVRALFDVTKVIAGKIDCRKAQGALADLVNRATDASRASSSRSGP